MANPLMKECWTLRDMIPQPGRTPWRERPGLSLRQEADQTIRCVSAQLGLLATKSPIALSFSRGVDRCMSLLGILPKMPSREVIDQSCSAEKSIDLVANAHSLRLSVLLFRLLALNISMGANLQKSLLVFQVFYCCIGTLLGMFDFLTAC